MRIDSRRPCGRRRRSSSMPATRWRSRITANFRRHKTAAFIFFNTRLLTAQESGSTAGCGPSRVAQPRRFQNGRLDRLRAGDGASRVSLVRRSAFQGALRSESRSSDRRQGIRECAGKVDRSLRVGTRPRRVCSSRFCRKNGQKQITHFELTPPFSTYLFAFAVGDLDFVTAKTKSGLAVSGVETKFPPICVCVRNNWPSGSLDRSQRAEAISRRQRENWRCLRRRNGRADRRRISAQKARHVCNRRSNRKTTSSVLSDNLDIFDFFHGGGIENFGLISYTNVTYTLPSAQSAQSALGTASLMCHEASAA